MHDIKGVSELDGAQVDTDLAEKNACRVHHDVFDRFGTTINPGDGIDDNDCRKIHLPPCASGVSPMISDSARR